MYLLNSSLTLTIKSYDLECTMMVWNLPRGALLLKAGVLTIMDLLHPDRLALTL